MSNPVLPDTFLLFSSEREGFWLWVPCGNHRSGAELTYHACAALRRDTRVASLSDRARLAAEEYFRTAKRSDCSIGEPVAVAGMSEVAYICGSPITVATQPAPAAPPLGTFPGVTTPSR